MYEHILWGPLIVFVIIAVILAIFTLIKIPYNESRKIIEPQKEGEWLNAGESDTH